VGKSVLVFDTETTGVNISETFQTKDQAAPLQFYGAIYSPPDDLHEWYATNEHELLVLPAMQPVVEVNILIQVPDQLTVEAGAVAVHGISREKANKYGISRDNAAHVISDLLDIADIAVAHNIDFDRRILNHFLFSEKVEFPVPASSAFDGLELFCTMKTLAPVCKIPSRNGGFKWPKLIEAYRFFFGRDFAGNAHDARADSIACAELYFAHRYFEQIGIAKKELA
jgi:DNA polymerase-3 subunit epsilon